MEDRLDLWLQIHPDHRLGDLVGHGGDGCFILPLLQSWVGMFSSVMELGWSAWSLGVMMPVGTDTMLTGQHRARDSVRWPAGLRCPDSVMRQRHSDSICSVQGMHSRLPVPRRAASLPVLIQS